MTQWKIQPEDWKEDYKEFDEATEKFYRGEMDAKTYKGHFWRLRKLCPKEAEMPVCSVCVCPAVLWI